MKKKSDIVFYIDKHGHRKWKWRTKKGAIYGVEAKGKWLVKRDGKVLASFPKESEAFGWLHRHYPTSVSHAIKYEGFEIVQSGKRKMKKVI